MVVNRSLLALLILGSVGCTNLLSPESGYEPRKDPGTLTVRVSDQSGGPVRGARVSVEMTNASGGFFTESSQTSQNGDRTFYYVPAGRHQVEVVPPLGFWTTPVLTREVEVVKGALTTTDFVLVRGGG